MKPYNVTVSAHMHAPAALIYSIIADYHNGHPQILPKPPFIALRVEHGGIGAGTIITFQMRLFGKHQSFRAAVTEPQPSQVLVETNLDDGGAVTTFRVAPVAQGQHTDVTITTEGRTALGGVLGTLEKLLTTMFLRRTYMRELALLHTLAQQRYGSTYSNPR
jgi:Polyketide cyclase / dehydrase and lipid transport